MDTFTENRRPRAIRALLVDPFARRITEGWQTPGLDAIKATLSGPAFPLCDPFPTDPAEWGDMPRAHHEVRCIDIRSVGRDHLGQSVDVICDDEGRLVDFMACCGMGGTAEKPALVLAGRVLLVGSDDEGETCSTALPLFEAVRKIRWLPWDFDYSPPPMQFYAAEPGAIRPAFICRAI